MRLEEIELEQLAKENAAVKDLVDQIKEKQHQLKMIQTLIK
jgi:DnaJ-domain-containing protein 1